MRKKRAAKKPSVFHAVGLALIAAVIASLWPVETTFDVVVTTDRAQIVPAAGPVDLWPLPNARLLSFDVAEAEPIAGLFEPRPGTRIGLERVAKGALTIEFEAEPGAEAGSFSRDEVDPMPRRIAGDSFFSVPAPWFEEDGGRQLVLPFSGKFVLPDRISNLPGQPIVHEGVIRLLGRTLLGARLYEAGRFELGVGESFEVVDGGDLHRGFLLVDSNPSMRVAYRVVGSRGIVRRFGAQGYEVKVPIWARIRSDEVVQAFWSSFVLVLGWIAVVRKKKAEG